MICNRCTREIADASRFCYYCGSRQDVAPAAAPPPPPRDAEGHKRLMRSSTDVKIAGVCAGVASYLGWDVTVVRLLWVILVVFPVPSSALLAYIVCWIVMPVAPLPGTAPATTQTA